MCVFACRERGGEGERERGKVNEREKKEKDGLVTDFPLKVHQH